MYRRLNACFLGILALLAWHGLLSPTVYAADAPARPNVIVILVDDMGWTDLGCYGSDLFQTPNIDRLAKDGLRFTNAYAACTVCSPTRAAMMTGKYPARLHVTDWIPGHGRQDAKLLVPDWTQYLPREEVTLAEALKEAGYATGLIGKWHLGSQEEGWPDKHGFDVNLGGYHKGQPPSYFSPYKIPTLEDGPAGEYLTDREAAEAVKFIEQHKAGPFYLYMPHYAVHTPLQAKKDVAAGYEAKITPATRHNNAKYAAMVTGVDDSVGRIVAKLAELGLTERTLIVFTSDNGGLLRSTDNVPLRAGKGSAYEGGVRVPAIVKWPAKIAPGGVCDQPIITPDYYPTLLAATGIAGTAGHNAQVDGVSLMPLFADPKATLPRASLYWHYPHYHPGGATPYAAVRHGDWKLIEFYEDSHVELYNLKDDIGESRDQAKTNPDKAAELQQELHAWQSRVKAQMPRANPKFQGK